MDKMVIGQRLRYERQKSGLTLDELGNKIGVSKQCLSGWEHGRNMPDVISLYAMANIFHIKIEDFLFAPENDNLPLLAANVNNAVESENATVTLSTRETQLINKLRAMSSDRRKAVEILFGIRKYTN